MSQKKRGASNMKPIEAYESFESISDQRSKSLSVPFLSIEIVSCGFGYTTRVGVFMPRNIMAIVFSENISPFFSRVKAVKSIQSGEGARALYPHERLKDGTDLSGISWALGAQYMAATLSGLFPFGSGLCLQAKDSSPNIYHFIQRLKRTHAPNPFFYIIKTHTHIQKQTHTEQSCLFICKQTSPVWHHSTTAGYGSKKRQQITLDYINSKAQLSININSL